MRKGRWNLRRSRPRGQQPHRDRDILPADAKPAALPGDLLFDPEIERVVEKGVGNRLQFGPTVEGA